MNNVITVFCSGFCHEHALILYVYLSNNESGAEDSVLTVRLISNPSISKLPKLYIPPHPPALSYIPIFPNPLPLFKTHFSKLTTHSTLKSVLRHILQRLNSHNVRLPQLFPESKSPILNQKPHPKIHPSPPSPPKTMQKKNQSLQTFIPTHPSLTLPLKL